MLTKMPDRLPTDGAIAVRRSTDDRIQVDVTDADGASGYTLEMSEYNAVRVFVAMAVILGIPIPKSIARFKMG